MFGIPFLERSVGTFFKLQKLDDGLDRLNYYITSCMLVGFALMISAKQYVGSPIQCWAPNEFSGGWQSYADDICFIKSTYFVSPSDPNDQIYSSRDDPNMRISYYQWVPVFLALQAVFFMLPNFLWNQLHGYSGVDLAPIVTEAKVMRKLSVEDRKETVGRLATVLRESLHADNHCYGGRFASYRPYSGLGNFETTVYVFTKFLYFANVSLQLYTVIKYLGHSSLWGLSTLSDLLNGREWEESGVFPRVTFCDIDIRVLGNQQKYTLQCALMVNMFNEKIYLFLWFWFAMLLVVNICFFFQTLINMCFPVRREMMVGKWLRAHPVILSRSTSPAAVRAFTHEWLLCDGVLALRFIEQRAGVFVAMQICQKMFSEFVEQSRPDMLSTTDFDKSGDFSNPVVPPPNVPALEKKV